MALEVLNFIHIKTRNKLEQAGTTLNELLLHGMSWNHLELDRTIWNKVEPPETRWTEQQTKTEKQEIYRTDCAYNTITQWNTILTITIAT